MSRKSRAPSILAGLAATLVLGIVSTEVRAQASGCEAVQSHLEERKTIAQSLQAGGKKQMDAKVACTGFNKLVTNGTALLKWTTTNKEWCQIPDSFVQSIQADHDKAIAIRTKACNVAAKIQQMEKQAKSGNGQNQLLGGGGLTGPTRLPSGAL